MQCAVLSQRMVLPESVWPCSTCSTASTAPLSGSNIHQLGTAHGLRVDSTIRQLSTAHRRELAVYASSVRPIAYEA
eukprot:2445048-Rhodomonas_salina.2